MKPLSLFVVCLAFSTWSSTGRSAPAVYQLDWSAINPAEPLNPEFHLSFSALPKQSIIATASTSPANPFPDLAQCLYIVSNSPDDPWFRLHGRPFLEDAAAQGAFQMEVCLVSGSVVLQVGHSASPWDPAAKNSYTVTAAYCSVVMTPGQQVQVQGRRLRSDGVDLLESGKKYVLAIKWDFSAAKPACNFYLNGEPLTRVDGTPFSQSLSAEEAKSGLNAFRIALGANEAHSGEFFLGRISALSGETDIHAAGEPLWKAEGQK